MKNGGSKLTCRDLLMGASEYLDGELGAGERNRFEEHQAECPGCRETVTSLKLTIDGIRGLSHHPEPSRLNDLLAETMRKMNKQRS